MSVFIEAPCLSDSQSFRVVFLACESQGSLDSSLSGSAPVHFWWFRVVMFGGAGIGGTIEASLLKLDESGKGVCSSTVKKTW